MTTVKRIESLTDDLVDVGVDILLRAFGNDDVLLEACSEGKDELKDSFLRPIVLSTSLDDGGEFYLASNSAGEFVGTSIWFAPGGSVFSSPESKKNFGDMFLSKVSDETQKWWIQTYAPTQSGLSKEALGPKGNLDTWYCVMIGVLPEHQRQGVATAMFQEIERKAQGTTLSITAGAKTNETIYNALGFKTGAKGPMVTPKGNITMYVLSKELK